MRFLLNCLFWGFVSCLFYGFYHKNKIDYSEGEKWIGGAVLALSFIYLPLFLIHRWKGKKLSDYTLTEENFKRIRKKKEQNSDFQ